MRPRWKPAAMDSAADEVSPGAVAAGMESMRVRCWQVSVQRSPWFST